MNDVICCNRHLKEDLKDVYTEEEIFKMTTDEIEFHYFKYIIKFPFELKLVFCLLLLKKTTHDILVRDWQSCLKVARLRRQQPAGRH